MTLFIGADLCTLYPNCLREENAVKAQTTNCIHPDCDYATSKAVDYLLSNGKAHLPHKFPCVQAQKEFDGKFFLTACWAREYLTHKLPFHLRASYQQHSKHPYTQLNRTYYLYTLEKILI